MGNNPLADSAAGEEDVPVSPLLFAMVDAVMMERARRAHEAASINARYGMVSMTDTNRILRHMRTLGWWRSTR